MSYAITPLTFDTYLDAAGATMLSGENCLTLLGYYAIGDGGLASYTRVPYSGNAVFAATFSGTIMNVSAVSSGMLAIDVQQLSGHGLSGSATRIVAQTSGTLGGVGIYQIDTPQSASGSSFSATGVGPSQGGLQTADGAWWELDSDREVNIVQFGAPLQNAMFAASFSGTTMTVTSIVSGVILVGQPIYGTSTSRVAPNPVTHVSAHIVSGPSGGGIGTYTIDVSQPSITQPIFMLAPRFATFTADFSGTIMTVTGAPTGSIFVGQVITGSGLVGGAIHVVARTSSAGFGTYTIDVAQPSLTGVSVEAIVGNADCRDALFDAQNYLARKFGGGIVNMPSGYFYHRAGLPTGTTGPNPTVIAPASNVTYRGCGRFSTVIVHDDTRDKSKYSGYFSLFYSGKDLDIENVAFEDFSFRGILDIDISSNTSAVGLSYINGLTYRGLGVFYSRSSGLFHNQCMNLSIIDFAGYGSWGGMLSSRNCEDMIVSDFYIYGSQDDAISNHTTDNLVPPAWYRPLRQGISITNGVLEESQGPSFNGAKYLTFTNVTMRRPIRKGLEIGRAYINTGNTSAHSITISNVIISDLIRFSEPADFYDVTPNSYLALTSGWRATAYAVSPPATVNKSYIGAPSRPDAAGAMTDLYGTGMGNFETNGTNDVYAGAGSAGITISNVILQRTLPSVGAASDWGFNPSGLFAPKWMQSTDGIATTTYYNGPIVDEMFNNYGLYLGPTLIKTAISDSIIRGMGDRGIYLTSSETAGTQIATFQASCVGTTMTVTKITTGLIVINQTITGSGVTSARILSQVTGNPGETGDYLIDVSQTFPALTAVTATITITTDVDQYGFDDLQFSNVRVSDFNFACVSFNGPSGSHDNVIFRDCVFDGDPQLRSQQRGITNKAVWQMKGAFTASISGTTMTVTAVSSGSLVPGQYLFGPSLVGNVQISSQSSGTPGGPGTYIISSSQTVLNKPLAAVPTIASSFTATFGGKVMAVSAVDPGSGSIIADQIIYVRGSNIGSGIHVIRQTSGTPGGVGNYDIDTSVSYPSSTAAVGWIADGPVGADVSRAGGFRFIGCQFRNLVQPIVEGSGRPNFKQNNLVLGEPFAFGFSSNNEGVAYCPTVGEEYTVLWEESDPANYQAFGAALETGASVSAAMPVSGYYAPGQFVSAQTPVISSGKVLAGWRRLTFGNTHVSGTDWVPQYISTT
jgi:hypothetical protein